MLWYWKRIHEIITHWKKKFLWNFKLKYHSYCANNTNTTTLQDDDNEKNIIINKKITILEQRKQTFFFVTVKVLKSCFPPIQFGHHGIAKSVRTIIKHQPKQQTTPHGHLRVAVSSYFRRKPNENNNYSEILDQTVVPVFLHLEIVNWHIYYSETLRTVIGISI